MRARRSQTVIAAGLILAVGLGGSVLMWDPRTQGPAAIVEQPDLPPALTSWSTSAQTSLASVEAQLRAAHAVLARWRAVPSSRRPDIDPPPVRDLLNRIAALERQRLTLQSQLSTWQSLRDTESRFRDMQARLAEIDRARGGARDTGTPSVSALDTQRDVVARQAGLLQSQLVQWRRDVDAAARGPLPDAGDTTAPLSSRVEALIDRRGPREAPRGVSPDVLAQALPVRDPLDRNRVPGARVAAGGAPNPGLGERPVRQTPADDQRRAVPRDDEQGVGRVTDAVADVGEGVTDAVLPSRGSGGDGERGSGPIRPVTRAVDDVLGGSSDDTPDRGPIGPVTSAVGALAGPAGSGGGDDGDSDDGRSDDRGSGLSGTVASTVAGLGDAVGGSGEDGAARGSGEDGTIGESDEDGVVRDVLDRVGGSGTGSSDAPTDRAGATRSAAVRPVVADVLDSVAGSRAVRPADGSADDARPEGGRSDRRDRVSDLVEQTVASVQRDGTTGAGESEDGGRSVTGGTSRGSSRSDAADRNGSEAGDSAGRGSGSESTESSDDRSSGRTDRAGDSGETGSDDADTGSRDRSGSTTGEDTGNSGGSSDDAGDEGSASQTSDDGAGSGEGSDLGSDEGSGDNSGDNSDEAGASGGDSDNDSGEDSGKGSDEGSDNAAGDGDGGSAEAGSGATATSADGDSPATGSDD